MKTFHEPIELIIHAPIPPVSKRKGGSLEQRLRDLGLVGAHVVRPVTGPVGKGAKRATTTPVARTRVITEVRDTEVNPWDLAHLSVEVLGAGTYVEPDAYQEFVVSGKERPSTKRAPARKARAAASKPDPDWPPSKALVWHLDDDYSQLRKARAAISATDFVVRIGHLDTGHSREHPAIPARIHDHAFQRNFVDNEDPGDAEDRFSEGMLRQPGHGPATLSLLAGGRVTIDWGHGEFQEEIGGAPFADVVCCRIARSVVLFKTSAFADALDHLTGLAGKGMPVHVVSMSMGGAPSKAWAAAVNSAYMAGITMVTAAGNNYSGFPTRHVIYPARFERVLAACGATHGYDRYWTRKIDEMQGNYGPAKHMDRALAAYTPNTPWANLKTKGFDPDGAGTSSATPQIAAAAAIYFRKHHIALMKMDPWRRVEAVRYALYTSARKQGARPGDPWQKYFGNGILCAADALKVPPNAAIAKAPEASIPWFPILSTILKTRPGPAQRAEREMVNMEVAQLVYADRTLASHVETPDGDQRKMNARTTRRFVDALIAHPSASNALRAILKKNRS